MRILVIVFLMSLSILGNADDDSLSTSKWVNVKYVNSDGLTLSTCGVNGVKAESLNSS